MSSGLRGKVGGRMRAVPGAKRPIVTLALLVGLSSPNLAGQEPPAEKPAPQAAEQEQAQPKTAAEIFEEIEDFILIGKPHASAEAPSGERQARNRDRRNEDRKAQDANAQGRSSRGGRQDQTEAELGGHVKTQGLATTYPEESLFRDLWEAESLDANVDVRLNAEVDFGRLDIVAHGQLVGLFGDRIETSRTLAQQPGLGVVRFQEDSARAFDLTSVHHDSGRSALISRLDRLSVGYTGPRNVLRLGRQAVSWGNGFAYTPMDIFNPFDPAAVDKEFKAGDDMLYGQHLLPRGDDLQLVWVSRRNALGEIDGDRASVALKYHGLFGSSELDVLVARHYDDDVYGLGGSTSLGGAVWRGDVVVTDSVLDTTTSVVTGITYSWVWGGKNFTGFLEGHWNGFGLRDRDYSPSALSADVELVERLARRELFTLGRRYAAASMTIEVTPLFILTPNLFVNAEDSSGLLQIIAQNDLSQNLILQTALGLPFGSLGTEFGGTPLGGMEAGSITRYLASGPSLFLQLARYF